MQRFKLLSFIVGCLIGLALLEIMYQIVEIKLPYHQLTQSIGKKMLPSRRITYFEDGFYLGRTNKYGYLGKSYPYKKENGKIRIAILGDSYVEGFHVFEQYHFSYCLEQELNKNHAVPKYEVLNFGVGNYNYNDMIILFRNWAELFNPDILIFIVATKDFMFRENFIPSPNLILENDSLTIDYSFINNNTYKIYSKFSFLFENSCVVKAVNNAYKLAKKDMIKQVLFDKLYLLGEKGEIANDIEENTDNFILDARVLKSFTWLKERQVYFVFRDVIPTAIKEPLHESGISYMSVKSILDENYCATGLKYDFWDVTGLTGHWNHHGQQVVTEAIFNLIIENEK